MSNPLNFSSTTQNIGLPLLIAGQAQKEFFVNQALDILDTLHPHAVVASQAAPPQSAVDGDCFRVTAPATQAWEGCESHLAVRVSGDWLLSRRAKACVCTTWQPGTACSFGQRGRPLRPRSSRQAERRSMPRPVPPSGNSSQRCATSVSLHHRTPESDDPASVKRGATVAFSDANAP